MDNAKEALLTPIAASKSVRKGFCRLALIWPHAATMRLIAATTVGCVVKPSSGEAGLYGVLSEGKSKSDLSSSRDGGVDHNGEGGVLEERLENDFGLAKLSERWCFKGDFGVCFGVTGENVDMPGDDGGVVNDSELWNWA
jgi:hypothetical protein